MRKTETHPLSQLGVMGSIPQSSERHFQQHPLHCQRGASCEQKSTPPQSADTPEIPLGLQPSGEWLTGQTVCSGISPVPYHQQSEPCLQKEGNTCLSCLQISSRYHCITDLTGTAGCVGEESLRCRKEPQRRLSMESQFTLPWVLIQLDTVSSDLAGQPKERQFLETFLSVPGGSDDLCLFCWRSNAASCSVLLMDLGIIRSCSGDK